ncbi:MAG: BrxE family protein [Thermoanaerobaculia bacterium]
MIDLDRLLELRLVVARVGEMDLARWWNTNGLLGRKGRSLLSRGFPATHRFAGARAVFAVARSRCHELFDLPGSLTLWNLSAALEDQFDAHWHTWLGDRHSWDETFERLEAIESPDLLSALRSFDLLPDREAARVARLRRKAEQRAAQLPGRHPESDETLTLLAAGFSLSKPGKVTIPYVLREDG